MALRIVPWAEVQPFWEDESPLSLGITAVLFGLFIWLGGLGLRKQLLILVGALSGAIGAYISSGQNIILSLAAAAIAALIAVKLEKIFLTILAAALAAAIAFALVAKPYSNSPQHNTHTTTSQNQEQIYNAKQTVHVINAYVSDLSSNIKNTCRQMSAQKWMIILTPAAVVAAVGLFYWPLTSAFSCATLGTISTFLGMTMLLLFKRSAPISGIFSRTTFFMTIFAAMVTFGTIEQLMLCKYSKQKTKKMKNKDKSEQKNEKVIASWRTT